MSVGGLNCLLGTGYSGLHLFFGGGLLDNSGLHWWIQTGCVVLLKAGLKWVAFFGGGLLDTLESSHWDC